MLSVFLLSYYFFIVALLITGCGMQQKEISKILMSELKTYEFYEYTSDVPMKYYIDSQKELEKFYSLYAGFKKMNIDKDTFNDNKVFIQVIQESSGDINLDLVDVTFDNNIINFIIESEGLGMTEDIACWYLVAIIPNEKLKGVQLDDWSKP